tara:strand:+ start:3801 stop:4952 length:1152 start_codon:yes stop_codon:yes gene_type:complete
MTSIQQEVLDLAQQLISRSSVTPDDKGCQKVIADYLKQLGFHIEPMIFDDTTNLWARRGQEESVFCFAGHTDVVPAGNLSQWHSDPFQPEIRNGHLFGRGAADMKGSLAAMLVATKYFVQNNPQHKGSIAFLITSDEEGPFINGTIRVIETLEQRQEKIKWAVVGEPSSRNQLGDVIKNGRRGSLTGHVTVTGIQGHVAYPHLARNPIHLMTGALAELTAMQWDQGNAYFPPTSFQLINIQSGEQATNVIPSQAHFSFNFRYSTEVTAVELQERVEKLLKRHQVPCDITWSHSGKPFLTESGRLVEQSLEVVYEKTGIKPKLETSGGTSDGRFIAPTGAQVIELGPINATIHQVNECVAVDDLVTLTHCYEGLLEKLLCPTSS